MVVLLAIEHGDEDGAKTECRRFLADVTDVKEDSVVAFFAAWCCILQPGLLDDYDRAKEIANALCELQPDHRGYLRLAGALHYRAGEYE